MSNGVFPAHLPFFLIATLTGAAAVAQPVTGVAGARFHVADLAKARDFYTKIFGFQEKTASTPGTVRFQLSADQYLEFTTNGAGDTANPLELIVFASKKKAPTLQDPDGRRIEFAPASHMNFRPTEKSLSDHMIHIGMGVADMNRAIDFYSKLGCKEIFRRPDSKVLIMRTPGSREDWVEFILRGDQGSDHIGLDAPDIQRAYRALIDRGAEIRGKPRIASNGHWVINMVDTNGIRVELMEPKAAAK
jgi:catechol 2,3-dioxygenase-like lactoylglutathione lyase family enzyme